MEFANRAEIYILSEVKWTNLACRMTVLRLGEIIKLFIQNDDSRERYIKPTTVDQAFSFTIY